MTIVKDKKEISSLLERRVASDGFFPSRDEIESKLQSGQGLDFYYGIDPTGKDIHLGHVIQLLLLKGLHSLGHKITLLIGDFTARIGDPTGKDKSRVILTEKDVHENMKSYIDQVKKILPENTFKVRYNSEWLSKLKLEDILNLSSQITVQQLIIRDMFQERLKNEKPIGVHEFFYPIMQGYDSVALATDGEIGGHDQIFNMLVGRDMVKKNLGKDKIVLATRLLVNSVTGKKMSKSEGEIIAISDEPNEIRRKILAMDDGMIKTLFELCTEEPQEWIDEKLQNTSPREAKESLAEKIIELFHGKEGVGQAKEPKIGSATGSLAVTIKDFEFASSVSEAKKLITGNAVKVNGEVVNDWDYQLKEGDTLQVGKGKFGKIK